MTAEQLRDAIRDLEAYVREEFGNILERDVNTEKNKLENSALVKWAIGLFIFIVVVNLILLLHVSVWDGYTLCRARRNKR